MIPAFKLRPAALRYYNILKFIAFGAISWLGSMMGCAGFRWFVLTPRLPDGAIDVGAAGTERICV